MKITTGCDIVQLSRLGKALQERTMVLGNLFTPYERKNQELEHLAGIFAAKEATIKALQLKAGQWLDYEIKQNSEGQPRVEILNPQTKKKIQQISLSISHDGDYALAVVVVVLN